MALIISYALLVLFWGIACLDISSLSDFYHLGFSNSWGKSKWTVFYFHILAWFSYSFSCILRFFYPLLLFQLIRCFSCLFWRGLCFDRVVIWVFLGFEKFQLLNSYFFWSFSSALSVKYLLLLFVKIFTSFFYHYFPQCSWWLMILISI